mmetsp:Transcript_21776/g.64183  ORF Transcript_21776/g.64183 Transcript_21776/m.64183 type:complete len:257 (+) Transcript_21776:206-976(+)
MVFLNLISWLLAKPITLPLPSLLIQNKRSSPRFALRQGHPTSIVNLPWSKALSVGGGRTIKMTHSSSPTDPPLLTLPLLLTSTLVAFLSLGFRPLFSDAPAWADLFEISGWRSFDCWEFRCRGWGCGGAAAAGRLSRRAPYPDERKPPRTRNCYPQWSHCIPAWEEAFVPAPHEEEAPPEPQPRPPTFAGRPPPQPPADPARPSARCILVRPGRRRPPPAWPMPPSYSPVRPPWHGDPPPTWSDRRVFHPDLPLRV